MRTDLKLVAALAAITVGGIGYHTVARGDDPAASPAAERTDRAAPDMPQSPAANDVREIFSQATSAAVQGKFEDFAKRLAGADRKHLNDGLKNNATLRDHFSQFEQDWKSRYNQEFDSSNIDKALVDSTVHIFQGDYSDRAKMAANRIAPTGNDAQRDPPADNNKPAAVDKNAATVYFDSGHNLAPAWVVLHKEEGLGNTWRIDVPDNISAQMFSDSLTQHVQMIQNQKGSWPADVNDAYRMIAHHVAVAVSNGATQSQSTEGTTLANRPGFSADVRRERGRRPTSSALFFFAQLFDVRSGTSIAGCSRRSISVGPKESAMLNEFPQSYNAEPINPLPVGSDSNEDMSSDHLAISHDESVRQLNSFLRGEISAAETYRMVIDNAADSDRAQISKLGLLGEIQQEHGRSAQSIRERIRELNGAPSDSSGAWGVWARTVQGSANLLGDSSSLTALKEGEEHGLKDYRDGLKRMDALSAELVQNQLIPSQQRHINLLSQLINSMRRA